MNFFFKSANKAFLGADGQWHFTDNAGYTWNANTVAFSPNNGQMPLLITPAVDNVYIDDMNNPAGPFTTDGLVSQLQSVFPNANTSSGGTGTTDYNALSAEVAGKLTASNNLSDIPNATTARTNLGFGNLTGGILSLTDAAIITLNAANLYIGYVASVILGGNRTLTISNATDGQNIVVRVTQDATGSRTLTVTNGRATTAVPAISLATAAGAITYVSLRYEATLNKFAYTGLSY